MPRMLRYQEIEGWLLQELSSGRFSPSDRFHSDNEVSRRFHAHRSTVRQAFRRLEEQGYLQRRRGAGTFVIHRPNRPEQLRLFRRCLFGVMIAEGPFDNSLKTGRLLIALHRAIEAAGYLALLTSDNATPLLEAEVNAVVTFQMLTDDVLNSFRDAGIPVAGMHSDNAPYPTMRSDFNGAAQSMVELFCQRGLKRLLVVGAGADAERVNEKFKFPLDQATHLAGIECNHLVTTFEEFNLKLLEWLCNSPKPDIIFALNSWCLDQIFTVLRQVGLSIPNEISLLVHGSNSLAIPCDPPCSIIDIDPTIAATETVNCLMAQIRNQTPTPQAKIPYLITDRGSIRHG